MNEPTHDIDYGAGAKTLPMYVSGLIGCIILTLIPYFAVKYAGHNKISALEIIFICGLIQFMVQLLCFIRLNTSTKQSVINVMSFVMTLIIVFILVAGSLWIMVNLDYNMMH